MLMDQFSESIREFKKKLRGRAALLRDRRSFTMGRMNRSCLLIFSLSLMTGFLQVRLDAQTTWYKNAYRRAVIDMHISDWDEKFLSEFDAARYADMLVKSRAQSIVCYAQSHVGLFNYP